MFPQEGSPAPPEPPESTSDKGAILKYVLLAAAAIYVIASLYLIYGLQDANHGLGREGAGAGS